MRSSAPGADGASMPSSDAGSDLLSDRAGRFWAWFDGNADRVKEDYRANRLDTLVSEVDVRVRSLMPELRWEIGPAPDSGDLFFAISPSGSRDRLATTRSIVALAPELDGWTILPAKPAKQWHRRRAQLQSGGTQRWADFDRWTFQAATTRLGLSVRFVPRDVEDFEESNLEGLAWLFLDWELGEEFVLDHINEVTAAASLDAAVTATELRGVLRSLVSSDG